MFILTRPIGRKDQGNVRSTALMHTIYFDLFQCLLNGWPQSPWLTTCTPPSLMSGDMVSCYGSWSLWAGLHTLGLIMIASCHFSGLDIGWASHKDAQSLCKLVLYFLWKGISKLFLKFDINQSQFSVKSNIQKYFVNTYSKMIFSKTKTKNKRPLIWWMITNSLLILIMLPRYNLMLSCWNIQPDGRPSFRSLTHKLENILLNSEDYLELDTGDEDSNTCNIVYNSGYTSCDTHIEEKYPMMLNK